MFYDSNNNTQIQPNRYHKSSFLRLFYGGFFFLFLLLHRVPINMPHIATSLCTAISCVSQNDFLQLPVGVNFLPLIKGGCMCVGEGKEVD